MSFAFPPPTELLAAPTSSLDRSKGYRIGHRVVDKSTTPPTIYTCVKDEEGSASWKKDVGGPDVAAVSSGVDDHKDLKNITWKTSGHTGDVNSVPYFNNLGAPTLLAPPPTGQRTGKALVWVSDSGLGWVLVVAGFSLLGSVDDDVLFDLAPEAGLVEITETTGTTADDVIYSYRESAVDLPVQVSTWGAGAEVFLDPNRLLASVSPDLSTWGVVTQVNPTTFNIADTSSTANGAFDVGEVTDPPPPVIDPITGLPV
jgi:hypothetical protein